jgi:hypothetical protein
MATFAEVGFNERLWVAWKRRERQECALRRQEKSFSSLEVSRIEVQGVNTASIKLAITVSSATAQDAESSRDESLTSYKSLKPGLMLV